MTYTADELHLRSRRVHHKTMGAQVARLPADEHLLSLALVIKTTEARLVSAARSRRGVTQEDALQLLEHLRGSIRDLTGQTI
jgi:hypothetical protein